MRAMSAAGSDTSDTSAATKATHEVARWRRILCGVLVVIVCVLVPVSILAVWTRNTLLDTDQYVETVGPLAGNQAIQQAVADRIVIVLKERVDLESKVEEALPERAKFVVPFVAQGIRGFIRDQALRLLQSEQFQTLWDGANRRAHRQVVALLTGNEGGRIRTKDGKVAIELGPVIEKVNEKLTDLGVDVFDDETKERGELVLFQSEDLTKIQGAVDLLDQIAVILPILLLVLLIAAIALSGNRRRTVLRAAIGIAISAALVLIVFNLLRTVYLDAVESASVDRDAADAVYEQILQFLRLSLRTTFVVAIVVAIGAWVAGPGSTATRLREGVKGLVNGDEAAAVEQSSLGRFVARYKTALRVVVVLAGLVLLMALSQLTPLTVLVIAVLVVIGLLLVEFLGRGGSGAEPDAGATPPTKSTAKKTATKRSS
jgi:hypothetical protein